MTVRLLVLLSSFSLLLAAGCNPDSDETGTTPNGAEDVAAPGPNDVTPPGSGEDTTTPPESDIAETPAPDTTIEPGPDAAEDPDVGEVEPRPPVVKQYKTAIGGWTMKPGGESTKCMLKRLDNPEEAWVTGIHNKLGPGSHHLVVYRSGQTEEKLEPFNCTPFVETLSGETIPLIITQKAEESLILPSGVAFKFEPNQMIRLEVHYLNYFSEDITTKADVTFDTIAAAHVEHEADMLFYGTPDFTIPAGKEHQTPWFFLDVWEGTKVFAMTGHTHGFGTNVEVNFATGKNDGAGDELYPLDEPFKWDEAPVTRYEPALEFGSGEGFRYRCTWNNTSDKSVGFGESASKEMCFFWAYYYPSKGYRMCVNPGSFYPLDKACCPDLGPLCSQITDFL